MTQLYKCTNCNEYTLNQKTCPQCGSPVADPKPPKYSPQDKYGEYRRKAKRKMQQQQ